MTPLGPKRTGAFAAGVWLATRLSFAAWISFLASASLAATVSLFCLLLLSPRAAFAQSDDTPEAMFDSGSKALAEGRITDAIAALEALADRGVTDPVASYDRGLAYAARVRAGAERPGDLGRAAHGFEEARDLSRDPRLQADASSALAVIRGEVARRRMRAGEPSEVDPARSFASSLAGLLAEDTWALFCALASGISAAGLFAHWLAKKPRVRVAGAVMAGIGAPVLAASIAMTLAARSDRLNLHEAVVVSASAHPEDDHGLSVPGTTPLPEGARVEVLDERGAIRRIRFGTLDTWLARDALRDLARRR
jgi:hypothetical protein